MHSNDSEQLMDDIFIKICSIDIQIKSTFSHYLTSMSFFNPLPEFQLATKGMILPNNFFLDCQVVHMTEQRTFGYEGKRLITLSYVKPFTV